MGFSIIQVEDIAIVCTKIKYGMGNKINHALRKEIYSTVQVDEEFVGPSSEDVLTVGVTIAESLGGIGSS